MVLLGAPEYFAQPGQSVRFDASDSYAPKDAIVDYDWDFDGDGTYEEHTTAPTATHTYPAAGKVNMAVQVTDAAGRLGSMSAPVTISNEAPAPDAALVAPPVPLQTAPGAVTAGVRDVTLTWTPAAGAKAATWLVYQDGVPLGTVEGDKSTVTVRGVPTTKGHEFAVAGLNDSNLLGDQAKVVVPRVEPPAPPGTPTTPQNPGFSTGPAAPTVTVPPVTTAAKANVKLSSTATDALFDVQVRSAKYNKAFSSWRALPQSTKSAVRGPALKAGFTQCYRARVSAAAGTSTWSKQVCTARPVDAADLDGSGWRTTPSAKAYGKSLTTPVRAGAVLRLGGVRTARLALSYATCSSCGKIVVKVGAKKIATIDTVAKSQKMRVRVLTFKKFKQGTVSIRPADSSSTVYVDALAVIRRGR